MPVPWQVIPVAVVAILAIVMAIKSVYYIGPTDIGLVSKRFGKRLSEGNVIAMNGEAGYQAELLMPGWRIKLWPIYSVDRYPWVQVPAGEIGVVIAQVGQPLPIGAKSAIYKSVFGNFGDLKTFLDNEGQKGVQRPVLPPGSLVPIHPVGFLVITAQQVFGVPVSNEYSSERLSPQSFGLDARQLLVFRITPEEHTDSIGIVTVLEGEPLPEGDIASRLGGYSDISAMEGESKPEAEIIEALLGSKNGLHNNYQDFQGFLENGGKIGLQHDPLLYGAYLLNPFLVSVERVPMLVVQQGEVAVIKSYVGLPTVDTSGEEFKFGSIVHPGHRGIWAEPLRTGKYAINPRCYSAEIVPTSILTLNWADATSQAHNLDQHLSAIDGKSREGFVFRIDLQVQIHVPDTRAPKVISMVGTMANLVNEVLQSAVGNYFRNSLQQLQAIEFIQTRNSVQEEAERYVTEYLSKYEVEVRGVYIQDVVLPEELVVVLQQREIANQEKETYGSQQAAQEVRVSLERSRGTADMQAELAKSEVSIEIKGNAAKARTAEGEGEAAYTKATGGAEADIIEAKGVARAKGYEAQAQAIGQDGTAMVAALGEVGEGHVQIVPNILVSGGGSSLDGLAGTLMGRLSNMGGSSNGDTKPTPAAAEPAAAEPPRSDAADVASSDK